MITNDIHSSKNKTRVGMSRLILNFFFENLFNKKMFSNIMMEYISPQ